jgi:hypothetical protein
MPTINLGLVALPNGLSADGKRLRVSVVVAPRLGDGAALSDFGDFQHWTKRITASQVSITLEIGAKKISAKPIPPVVDPKKNKEARFRPDLWDALFPGTVPVSPHHFDDYRGRLVISYPALTTLTALKGAYQIFGLQFPDHLPQIPPPESEQTRPAILVTHPALNLLDWVTRLLSPFDVWPDPTKDATKIDAPTFLETLRDEAHERQKNSGGAFKAVALGPPGADGVPTAVVPQDAINEAAKAYVLFHAMPVPDHDAVPTPTPEQAAARYDFHAVLTALNAYPSLMRLLGLILDVEIDPAAVADSPGAKGYETIAVDDLDMGAWQVKPTFDRPPTAYLHDTMNGKARFATAPSTPVAAGSVPSTTGDVWNGLLQLNPSTFYLTQLDVDGAMRQLMTFIEGVKLAEGRSQSPASLPAVRSAGLGLTISGRGGWLLNTFARNGALMDASGADKPSASGKFPPLTTLDVTRGYRMDVWSSQTGLWHSLHQRLATYVAGAEGEITIGPYAEEGFLQPSATASVDPSAKPDLYVHERLARWNGWSLSAPRPGRALNRSADPGKALDDDPSEGQPLTAFKLRSQFNVEKGSLPRLRFGTRYRVRLRAVDLAGNSRLLTDQDDAADSTLPVQPDGMPYLRFQPVPAPVVVPRADMGSGESVIRLVIRSFNDEPGKDGVPATEVSERHLAPPKTTLQLAEQHGALDAAPGLSAQATYDLVTSRDSNGPPELAAGDHLDVTWLPDPLSRGAALLGLPGLTPPPPERPADDPEAAFTRVRFDGSWPDPKAFRLSLAEGDGPPVWEASARVLRVHARKGSISEVRLSSFLEDSDLTILGAWQWLVEAFEGVYVLRAAGGDPGIAQALEGVVTPWQRIAALAPLGGLWLLTPYHTLTLVHAVQQPLGRPRFVSWSLPLPGTANLYPGLELPLRPLSAWRSQSSHEAYLFGAVRFHGSSTAKLEIAAEWTEPVDDPSKTPIRRSAVADSLTLGALDSPLMTAPGGRQTGNFANGEALARLPDVEHGTGVPDPSAPDAALMGLDNQGSLVAPRHEFGDTRHRVVTYRVVATSRFRDYFDHNNPSLEFTRTSDPVQVDVPSSAPPLVPELVSVLPAFGWTRNATPQVTTSVRRGGIVRIHLARPWFSSGEGELLGVLCRSPDFQSPPSDEWLSRHVTVWGQDPIRGTRNLENYPSQKDFPARIDAVFDATRSSVAIPGADPRVAVAAHAVGYDRDRDLMFADVEIGVPNTYSPFLRLALARYQPFSIPDVALSPVVLADIVQLTPDRTAALASNPLNAQVFVLSVSGIRPESSAPAPVPANLIVVEVERRVAGRTDELGWEAAGQTATVTPLAPPATTDTLLWNGLIQLSEPPGDGEYRVVVREFELLRGDADSEWPVIQDFRVGGRLVYAERLSIPGSASV